MPGKPYPTKLLSLAALHDAWRTSRDSRRKSGGYGVDGISTAHFGANLDENVRSIHARLIGGKYRFSKLRLRLIPKKDSDKKRVICIPTVADRLVQRAIARALNKNDRLRIRSSISYGFMEDVGTPHAVGRALSLRQTNNWVLKTDIVSFFDRIQRNQLITRLDKVCPASLLPLLEQVIDCEISATADERQELQKQGIASGEGLRQGMPLSPLLSNYVLRPFDRHAIKAGYSGHMVRYADDLIFLFPSKSDCKEAEANVRDWLAELKHSIPELNAVKTKTEIIRPQDPVEFLGIEIAYDGSIRRYVRRIPSSSIVRICNETTKLGSLAACRANNWSFANFALHMASKSSSYRATYEDTRNLEDFLTQLNASIRKSSLQLLRELFGTDAVSNLSAQKLRFLGLLPNEDAIEG